MPDRPLLPARLAIGLFLLTGVALPLAATVHARLSGPHLHGETVTIVGPAVVAQAAAGRANALPGHPVDARAVDVADAAAEGPPGTRSDEAGTLADAGGPMARDEVATGASAAAVVIDLRRTTDTFLVASWLPDRVAARLEAGASAVSGSYGRTLRTERVAPPHPASRLLPGRLVALLVTVGVGVATAISAWRGPVAATATRGVARLAGTAAAGVLSGVLVAALADTPGPGATGVAAAATATVAAWLVLAAESVLGLAGLGLAAGLLLGPVLPLVGGADPAYLPSPWRQLDGLGVQQASLRLLQHHLTGVRVAELRWWVVLAAWAATALLTLAAARAERPATRTR